MEKAFVVAFFPVMALDSIFYFCRFLVMNPDSRLSAVPKTTGLP